MNALLVSVLVCICAMSGMQGIVYAILVFYSIPLNYNCLSFIASAAYFTIIHRVSILAMQ